MRRTFLIRSGYTLAFVVSLGLGARPALAEVRGPTLEVSNPTAGDRLIPGSLVIQGFAYDDTAERGAGIDRVSVFLGDRDAGGQFLGDATLGIPNPQSVEGGDSQFALAGWRLTTPALKNGGDQRDLRVYARSSVTGGETIVNVPVLLGQVVHEENGGQSAAGGGAGGGD
jgi:hypothetical protein